MPSNKEGSLGVVVPFINIEIPSPAAPLLPLVDQVSAAGTITLFPKGSEETLNCDSASSYTVQESDHYPTQAFYLDIPVLYLL